jgi:hypothetical protein
LILTRLLGNSSEVRQDDAATGRIPPGEVIHAKWSCSGLSKTKTLTGPKKLLLSACFREKQLQTRPSKEMPNAEFAAFD